MPIWARSFSKKLGTSLSLHQPTVESEAADQPSSSSADTFVVKIADSVEPLTAVRKHSSGSLGTRPKSRRQASRQKSTSEKWRNCHA